MKKTPSASGLRPDPLRESPPEPLASLRRERGRFAAARVKMIRVENMWEKGTLLPPNIYAKSAPMLQRSQNNAFERSLMTKKIPTHHQNNYQYNYIRTSHPLKIITLGQ